MTKTTTNNKTTLFALLVIFFTPLLLAHLYYSYKTTHHPAETKNHGILIEPVINISKLILYDHQNQKVNFQNKWSMIYVLPTDCQHNCKRKIYDMHQIHKALGDKSKRVKRMVISYTQQTIMQDIQRAYPNTATITMTKKQNTQSYNFIRKTLALQPGYIYLVDPRGNLMMRYLPQSDAKGILKDIKQLLRVSQIG